MNKQPVVLYVEDDPNSRMVMKLLLSMRMKLPHVTFFEDSTDFLLRVQALDPLPDLVFLDIHMAPYNGFQMLEMLRQIREFDGIPVVAMTASVMNEEVALLQTAGFNGCIAKPIDLETFPDLMAQILDGQIVWRITS